MLQEYWVYGVGASCLLLLAVVIMLVRGANRKSDRVASPKARSTAPLQSSKATLSGSHTQTDRSNRSEAPERAAAPPTAVAPSGPVPTTTEPSTVPSARAIWKTRWGPLQPEIVAGEGFITLPPGVHAVTEEVLPTSEGDSWVVEFKARAMGTPTNGAPVTHWIGPMVLDANNEVLAWWTEQPPLIPGLPPRPSSAESRAPAGAAKVCIGLQGCMPDKGFLAADVEVEFTGITLRKRD